MLTIQIVPRLLPSVDGVGDYALSLAHRLDQDFNIKTHFLVGDPNWPGDQEVAGFKASQLARQTSESLLATLQELGAAPSSIILQYVGCGYARRGCPTWLVEGLAKYQAAFPGTKLVTMFHETYGSGPPYYGADPPWISAFWLAPLQKKIASHLTRLSKSCVTSREHFRDQLNHLTGEPENLISLAPVFSNVGEAPQFLPLRERQPIMVLFGMSLSRARVYQQFLDEIRNACEMLKIEEIYDIGAPTGLDITHVGTVPIVSLGEIAASEISEIFLRARAGILSYHPDFLAKSGMYAAYSAYGLIPIVASSNISKMNKMDGLHEGEQYWKIDPVTQGLDLEVGEQIASNAFDWYQSHNLSAHTRIFADAIRT
jgi:hypothetical protein